MTTTVIIPADGEPVSLAAMKDYLRIGHDGEDGLVTRLIAEARGRVEAAAGIAVVTRRLRLDLECWPEGFAGRGMRLRPGPAAALVSVIVGGEDVTARFQLSHGVLRLRAFEALVWPVTGEIISVEFETGFGASSDVPDALADIVKRVAADAYARRSGPGLSGELPADIMRALSHFREARL